MSSPSIYYLPMSKLGQKVLLTRKNHTTLIRLCILEEDGFCNASKRGASTIANIHIYVPKPTYSLALPSHSF